MPPSRMPRMAQSGRPAVPGDHRSHPMPRIPDHHDRSGPQRPNRRVSLPRSFTGVLALGAAALALGMTGCGSPAAPSANRSDSPSSAPATTGAPTTAAPPTTAPTTTSAPTTTAPQTHGPLTTPPLPAPGAGFVQGKVTAVGDSVMIDYQDPLAADIPGVDVQASVSRQWSDGEQVLQQLKAQGQLGAVVIVGLGTNGPISSSDVDAMMSILSGASRVVFVNVHVDQPWQDPNNAVLDAAPSRYPKAVVADWYALASANPDWLYGDETHLPIDGTGAHALADLVASKA